MITEPSLQEKCSAIGTLLQGVALMVLVVAVTMMLFGIAGNLVAHFLFGYSWASEKAHIDDWPLFFVLIATPLLLMGGLAWILLEDEYHRILQARIRK
ncbi:hypothetical protein [Acidithiobacillus thiooxidans]|uniref:hypothetical protein n=1 Tax=Acidithiobacillus thiooxidans TaxID=930 RepID=UPI0004E160A9|nr:hypothetical protein [Acidithiobacillus thiooxidans]